MQVSVGMCQVARDTTPNERYCFSASATCPYFLISVSALWTFQMGIKSVLCLELSEQRSMNAGLNLLIFSVKWCCQICPSSHFVSCLCLTPPSISTSECSKRVRRLRPIWTQRTSHHHHQTGSRAPDVHWLVPGLGFQDVGDRSHGQNPSSFLNAKLQAPPPPLTSHLSSTSSCCRVHLTSKSLSAKTDVIMTVVRLNGCLYALVLVQCTRLQELERSPIRIHKTSSCHVTCIWWLSGRLHPTACC